MYRRIVDYFVGAPTESTEGTVQTKEEEISKNDDIEIRNQSAKLTARIEQLENELKARTDEREALKNKLELAEKELLKLQMLMVSSGSTISTGVGEGSVNTCDTPSLQPQDSALQKEIEHLHSELGKSNELLKDKTELCSNQERQNLALTSQVASLKEVVAITKDLLNIRNMEVQHLQKDMESMETKINAERSRHNDLLQKMDEAASINAKLKYEYQTQLRIFQDLKDKYEEKVNTLNVQKEQLKKEIFLAKCEPNSSQCQEVSTHSTTAQEERNIEVDGELNSAAISEIQEAEVQEGSGSGSGVVTKDNNNTNA